MITVYLERGSKRTFAGAIEWPGWSRGGTDDASALQALLDYAPRYARALKGTRLGFTPPTSVSAFRVVETVSGSSSTDFGTPGAMTKADARPLDDAELRRQRAILRACWRAFDAAARTAKGKRLIKGPRGGGRDLDGIVEHVIGGDVLYLGGLGWKFEPEGRTLAERTESTHRAMLDGIAASIRGEIPARGPRGGVRWTPRRTVRRSAWHWLDHAWEIEDRSAGGAAPAGT